MLNQNSNIRRIDELGRVVIPKDIRKKLHIKENESLEIYIEQEEIRIKKYSSLPDILDFINYMFDIGNRTTNNEYILTNRERIVASTDKMLIDTPLNKELEELVLSCKEEKNIKVQLVFGEKEIKANFNIVPIIIDNDRSGLLIEYNTSNEIPSLNEIKIFKSLIEKSLNNY